MKVVNTAPVLKKVDQTDEANYSPLNILQNLSKVLERCLRNQLCVFFDKILFT